MKNLCVDCQDREKAKRSVLCADCKQKKLIDSFKDIKAESPHASWF